MEVTTSIIVRTLLGSGFQLINSIRKPSYLVFHTYRRDEFGVKRHYLFAFCGEGNLSIADITGLRNVASNEGASLIIIGDADVYEKETPVFASDDFVTRLGGAVSSFLPLEPEYSNQLKKLGKNELPKGLAGRADDLFEAYVQAGLQFLFQERVVRYGQDRRFEAVPDGLVLGRNTILLLYDCKAAKDGYDINRDSIRQFGDYVNSFHKRYEKYVGRLHAFLVISGSFQSEGTLDIRAQELYAECQIRLVFLTSIEMGKIVAMLAERPVYRQSIDWQKIFSSTVVTAAQVKKSLDARMRDRVISL